MAGEIFICYRRSDQDKAHLLHALLKQRGVDAWYDVLVGAGEDWRRTTAKALDAAPIFVLLFSKDASESDDIGKELAAATFSKKLVVPVRIENLKPSGEFLYELASRNWFDAFEDTEARFEVLADRLAALVKGGPNANVTAFSVDAQPALEIKAASRPLFKRPVVLGGLAAAALALVAAVAVFGLRPQGPPRRRQPVSTSHFSASRRRATIPPSRRRLKPLPTGCSSRWVRPGLRRLPARRRKARRRKGVSPAQPNSAHATLWAARCDPTGAE
jgi:hypothetical protein